MKLFKLLTTTAITTMAVAAMSVSASAALEATYTYDSANSVGTVALTGLPENATTQLTLLVLDQDATTVTEGMIKQIDQGTNSEIADVKVADLSALSSAEQTTLVEEYNALADADKTKEAYDKLVADCEESATYYVRVGGTQDENKNYVILTGEFTVPTTVTLPDAPGTGGGEGGEEPDEPISQWGMGDVDRDGYVGSLDAEMVMKAELWMLDTPLDAEQETLADADGDLYIGSLDAEEIMKFELWMDSALNQYYPDRM